jgi:dipeptidyl-peptidase-4
LEDNAELITTMSEFDLSDKEFFSFKTSEDIKLNGWMIKPSDFDASKKYPVFMFLYGGPGSQQVLNSWGWFNYFWYQHLAQKGYIVACIDNRGTGGRGAEFKKLTYQQLGKYETIDQIEANKYLGSLDYVDKDRIGIQGWSYGGYLSSLAITKGADYFKMAIAVAPVTNWRYYDNIYTERYMRTPQENPKGYDENSPINHVEKLKGEYLLIHGSADDNVHVQNTYEMISALVKANKQFDLFIYPDKNHGIYGGNTRLHLYKRMTNFIEDNL